MSGRLPALKALEVIRALEKAWLASRLKTTSVL
jgi:hypothetical protein